MARRRLEVEIVGDASKLDRAFKQAEKSTQRFGKKFSGKSGGGLGGLLMAGGKGGAIGAGVAVGGAIAVKTLSSVIAKAKEAEVAQANLSQAFAASGTSAKQYGKQVDAAIQSISKMAAVDDEEVSQSFANLLRATGSVTKATRDTALAANIARARRISLAAATKIVEKAELGQTRGLKAIGVELAKGATATEAIAAAQKKFAGAAERYGKTAAGAQEKYKVALENVEERIGAKLLPLQTKLALAAVRFLDWADKNWPRFAQAIGSAYQAAKPYIDNLIARIRDIGNVVKGVVEVIKGIRDGDWSLVWNGIKKAAVAEINLIYHSFVQLPLRIAKALGSAAWSAVTAAMRAAINKAIDVVNAAIKAINKAIPNFLGKDIPLVPKLGGGTSPKTSGAPAGAAGQQRTTQSHTPVQIVLDGRVIAETVIAHAQRKTKASVGQSRGRYPGSGFVGA